MSSLLELDSSYAQSISVKSTGTSQTYEKKWKAPVWQYCHCLTADKENQDHLYCSYCPSDSIADGYKEPYNTKIPTNMGKHLLGAHQIIVEKKLSTQQAIVVQQLKQFYHQAHMIGETEELDTKILKDQLNKVVITEALISLIVVQNLAYALVKWPEFHTLCQALNQECKGMITTTHSQVALKVKEAWHTYKDVV